MADPTVTGIAVMDTTTRNGLTDLIPGLEIFNTDSQRVERYDGTQWRAILQFNDEDGYLLDQSESVKKTLLSSGFYTVQTIDSTPTPILTFTMDEETMIELNCEMFAIQDNYGAGAFGNARCAFRRPLAANAVRIGASNGLSTTRNDFGAGNPSLDFTTSVADIIVNVVGLSTATINWGVYIELFSNAQ